MTFGFPSIEGGLIMWVRPKGLKVYMYVKMCADLKKNKLLKDRLVHKVAICNGLPLGWTLSLKRPKFGVPLFSVS